MFNEFFQDQWPLFLAALVITLMLVYSYVGDRMAGYKNVATTEATRLFNDGAFMLDVRTPGEYNDGFIGDAINISVSDVVNQLNKLPKDKETPILVYCQTGSRSAKAAGILAKNEYTNVTNLSGGITSWKANGLPVSKTKSKKSKKAKK